MEDLICEVAEHGGAAGRDATLSDLNDETGEEFLDALAGGEFGEFGEQVGGEVVGVTGGRRERESDGTEMAGTETGLDPKPGRRQRLPLEKGYRQRAESS